MKRIVVVAVILMIGISIAFSAESVNPKTFPLTSDLYDLMDDLYSLQGLARPSSSRPWSQSEAELIFSRIDATDLSKAQQRIYDSIQDILDEGLRWDFEDFSLGGQIDLAIEAYLHTNYISYSDYLAAGAEKKDSYFITDSDWIRGFEQRRPLAKASMDFSISDFFYTYCDLQYGYGRVSKYDNFVSLNPNYTGNYGILTTDGYIGSYYMGNPADYPSNDWETHMMVYSEQYSKNFATNILPKSDHFDFIWPKRAIFAVGGEKWSLQYGRDRLEIGNAMFGNMLVDNHTDFHDFLSATFYSGKFKYQWMNLFLNGITRNSEVRTDDIRIYMIHSLEFRPLKDLSFIISEDVMYKIASYEEGSQVMDLSFLNPSFIYHNLNNRSMFNAIAYAEVNWTPFKGIETYGQFALDQATAPNEDPNSQGAAWGFVVGTKYTKEIGEGVAKVYSEFAYTTPLLYRRDEVDFIKMTRYFHLDTDSQLQLDGTHSCEFGSNALVFEFIGFPYGGDAEVLELGGSYKLPNMLKAKVFGRFIQHGEFNMFSPHHYEGDTATGNAEMPNYQGSTPSGTKWLRAIVLSSNVEFDMETFFKWPGVTLEAELDWVGKWDFDNDTKQYSNGRTDTQFSIEVNLSI